MDLVIDTSAIIAVVANEPEKSALIKHTIGVTLCAPASVPWEIGNAFSAMIRRKRITLGQAQSAIMAFRQIPIRFIEVDIRQALTYSERLGVYAYDAYFIEVAKQQQCPLLSLDRGLLHAAREAGVEVMEVIT
ncbi:MAG: type II toxin-antitoxin system VapC family toxin [Firmicutes bacterium]|nr:type II toxin-antitoxin system VapC family toxin [Bacillota bacterium]